MSRVSIVVPSRKEPYLNKTISDLLVKSSGDIEILAVLDGYWPDEYLSDPRIKYIHYSVPKGMRGAINAGVDVSTGQYIMKTDAHCMFSKGYDEELKKNCNDDWVVVPRRYPLNPELWQKEERTDNKYPIDYMILDDNLQGRPIVKENDKKIDDLMTSQGSCWFMKKTYFKELELLDEDKYGTFWQEMQEIGLKCWLSGGKMKVNKEVSYAHWHKNKGRGYSLPEGEQEKTREMINKWRSEKMFSKQIHDLSWLLERFR